MLLRSHGAKRPQIFDEKTPDEKTREKTLVNGASQCLPRSVLLQDDAEVEEGGGVLLRGRLVSGSAAERQGPNLQSARPVS